MERLHESTTSLAPNVVDHAHSARCKVLLVMPNIRPLLALPKRVTTQPDVLGDIGRNFGFQEVTNIVKFIRKQVGRAPLAFRELESTSNAPRIEGGGTMLLLSPGCIVDCTDGIE
jgi:hypothetical protein